MKLVYFLFVLASYFSLSAFASFSIVFIAPELIAQNTNYLSQDNINERITNLEKASKQNSPDYDSIAAELRKILNSYYSQFTEAKSILSEKNNKERPALASSSAKLNFNKNANRLIGQKQAKRMARPYFIKEDSNLFRLHALLANSYVKAKKHQKALASYKMAFRYAYIEPPSLEEQEKLKERLVIANQLESGDKIVLAKNKTKASFVEKRKQERYLWMKRFFASKELIAQTSDKELQLTMLRFQKTHTQFLEAKDKMKANQLEVALSRIKSPNAKLSLSDALRAQELGLEMQAQKMAVLETIRKGSYRRYLQKRRNVYGEAAYKMALETQKINQKNISFASIANPNSYINNYDNFLKEKKLPYQNEGFLNALEFTYKINPFHRETIMLLAKEYKRQGKLGEAILFTEIISRLEPEIKTQLWLKEQASYYLDLAKLYTNKKNYTRAIASYENYFKLQDKKDKKDQGEQEGDKQSFLKKALADLYFKRAFNFTAALKLYDDFLTSVKDIDLVDKANPNMSEASKYEVELKAMKSEVLINMASIATQNKVQKNDQKKEKKYLERAWQKLLEIEKKKQATDLEIQAIKNELSQLKRQLLKVQDEKLQSQYYILKDRTLAEKIKIRNWIAKRLEGLHLPKVLEALARIAFHERDLLVAKKYYRAIITRGSQAQVNRARENINRIDKNRSLVFEPLFER